MTGITLHRIVTDAMEEDQDLAEQCIVELLEMWADSNRNPAALVKAMSDAVNDIVAGVGEPMQ